MWCCDYPLPQNSPEMKIIYSKIVRRKMWLSWNTLQGGCIQCFFNPKFTIKLLLNERETIALTRDFKTTWNLQTAKANYAWFFFRWNVIILQFSFYGTKETNVIICKTTVWKDCDLIGHLLLDEMLHLDWNRNFEVWHYSAKTKKVNI